MRGSPTGWPDLLALALLAGFVFWLLLRSRGPGTRQIVAGLGIVAGVSVVGEWLEVVPSGWSLARFWPEIALAVLIVLQPEIRKALAALGRLPGRRGIEPEAHRAVEEVVKAAVALANRRIGALIVIERAQELVDAIEVGMIIDAHLSKELLISVFLPYSPLHDGAVILRGGRIVAAGCFLPLSARAPGVEAYGTRHRAAIGITEETDALAIVVSEETGGISLVAGGEIDRDLDGAALRRRLVSSLGTEAAPVGRWAWLPRPRSR